MTQSLLVFPLACVCIWTTAARAGEAPLAVPVEGESFHAQLVGADAAWNLEFREGDRTRTLPARDLAFWGTLVEPTRGAQIILPGGGLVVVDAPRIEKEQLVAESQTFGRISLPLERAAALLLRTPLDRAVLDRLTSRALAATGQTDRVVLDNGDELTGTIVSLADPAKPEAVLRLETESGQVDVAVEKIAAVMFNPSLVEKPRAGGLRGVVGLADGSRVTAAELVIEKQVARLKLVGGSEWKLPLEAIVSLEILGGRAVYLSDLKPASYRHIPYLELAWPLQADRSVLGSQLRAGGHLVLKGLGMHSPSRVTYELDGSYRRFQADVAIDDEAGPRGSVVFRVFTDDGSGAQRERVTTQVVRGGDPPLPISVDLEGVKRLSLLVDYADRGDEMDHADWLNARLIR